MTDNQTLNIIESIQKRPAMYLGSNSERGLVFMIREMLKLGIKAMNASEFYFQIEDQNSFVLKLNKALKVDAEYILFTAFSENNYIMACVNALSERFEATICQKNLTEKLVFENANLIEFSKSKETNKQLSTTFRFKLNENAWKNLYYSTYTFKNFFIELSFLFPKRKFVFEIKKGNYHQTFYSENGLEDALKSLNFDEFPFINPILLKGKKKDINIQIALGLYRRSAGRVISYINFEKTRTNGSHVDGFMKGFNKIFKKICSLKHVDFRGQLSVVIHLEMTNPHYAGCAKDQLEDKNVERIVKAFIIRELTKFFNENSAIFAQLKNQFSESYNLY